MGHIHTDHITRLTEEDSGEKFVLFTDDGTNGSARKFHFVLPNEKDLDLTGFVLRLRVMNRKGDTELIAPLTGTIIAPATAGIATFDFSAVNLTTAEIQDGAIMIFYNIVATKNEVIRQTRADIANSFTP